MTLKQLKKFFKLKILFFVCKLLCQEKKNFLCAKDDLLCAKAIFPFNITFKKNDTFVVSFVFETSIKYL